MRVLRVLFGSLRRRKNQSLYCGADARNAVSSPRPQAANRLFWWWHAFPVESAAMGANPGGDGAAGFAWRQRMDHRMQPRHSIVGKSRALAALWGKPRF